jgi:Dolichyl-phosphate-mannose-protein mannosyltransferase
MHRSQTDDSPEYDDGLNTMPAHRPRWAAVAACLICAAVMASSAALVLPFQSIWTDESCQMSGLEGNPIEATRWLAGRTKYNLWLQNDRMPPLSYWAGWLWSRTFGLAETPMRWFSVTCAAVAAGLVTAAAYRTWGLASGVAAGLLLGLSPNVIDHAVEIRAYAMFLMESAGAFACLTALLNKPCDRASRWLALMTMCGIAAIYTHFFGLVLSGSCLLAALVLLPRRGGRAKPILVAIAITGVAAIGVLPFALPSLHRSGADAGSVFTPKLQLVEQWVYRMYSHPTISLSPLEEGTAALGFMLAGAAALYSARRNLWGSGVPALGLVIALAAGAVATLFGLFLIKGMIATKPSYSAWMLPALALLLSSGLATKASRSFSWSIFGIILLLATYGAALCQRVAYHEWFTHAPIKRLTSLINEMGHSRVAVIYEGNRDAMLYFPIYYSFRDSVKQYVLTGQVGDKLELDPFPPTGMRTGLEDVPAEALIVIRSEDQRSADLVHQLRYGLKTFSVGPVSHALNRSARWKLTGDKSYRAFLSMDIHIFERVSTAPRPDL